jgi:hypothetical protein
MAKSHHKIIAYFGIFPAISIDSAARMFAPREKAESRIRRRRPTPKKHLLAHSPPRPNPRYSGHSF